MLLSQTCARCIQASQAGLSDHILPSTGSGNSGYIHGIYESLAAPSLLLLTQSYDMARDQRELMRCQNGLSQARNKPDSELKLRPCVLVPSDGFEDDFDKQANAQMICLGATLGGTEYEKLPTVYKHFFIPVYPNPHCANAPHLHTVPEWDNPYQWIFAYPWNTTKSIEIMWCPTGQAPFPEASAATAATEPQGIPYRFDEKSMALLQKECKRKKKEWRDRCSKNWRYAIQAAADWRMKRMNASSASLASNFSLRTKATMRTTRSRMVLDTLPEETDVEPPLPYETARSTEVGRGSSKSTSIHRGRMSSASSVRSILHMRNRAGPWLA